jgi:hypothetical protein
VSGQCGVVEITQFGVSAKQSAVSATDAARVGRMQRGAPRGGRPSKGDRWLVYARLPRELADLFQAEADRLGLTYNDLLTNLTAEHYGRPPVQLPQISFAEELPLTA